MMKADDEVRNTLFGSDLSHETAAASPAVRPGYRFQRATKRLFFPLIFNLLSLVLVWMSFFNPLKPDLIPNRLQGALLLILLVWLPHCFQTGRRRDAVLRHSVNLGHSANTT